MSTRPRGIPSAAISWRPQPRAAVGLVVGLLRAFAPLPARPARPSARPSGLRPAAAYPGDAMGLLARHAGRGLPVATVWTLAAELLAEDPRFAGGPHPLLRQLAAHRPSDTDRQRLAALGGRRRARLVATLTDDLVGLATRAPTRIVAALGSGPAVSFVQEACHLEETGGVSRLEMGQTLSSNAARRDEQGSNAHLRQHLAQAHAITSGGTLVAFRSARSDTVEKLRNKLISAATASLSAAGGDPEQATGWHRQGTTWTFSPVLITAMDHSLLKHLGMLVTRLFGGERSERRRLADMAAAQDALFAGDQSLAATVEVGGVVQRLRIGRPSMVNVVLSSQSNSADNLAAARRHNQARMLPLVADLARRWAGHEQPGPRLIAGALAEVHSVAEAKERLRALLQAPEVSALTPRQRLALQALWLTFLGHTQQGQRLLGNSDPGREVLLHKALMDEAGAAALIECKSGVDRTLTIASLLCAAEVAAAAPATGGFDPLAAGANEEAMRGLFGRLADGLGADTVRLTRGAKGRIKWHSQPTPRAWYPAERQAGSPLGDFTR